MHRFTYEIMEYDARRTQMQIKGEVIAPNFQEAVHAALHDSFRIVTEGKATVYGSPGEGGCRGPYTITKCTIERMEK